MWSKRLGKCLELPEPRLNLVHLIFTQNTSGKCNCSIKVQMITSLLFHGSVKTELTLLHHAAAILNSVTATDIKSELWNYYVGPDSLLTLVLHKSIT